MGCLLPSFAVAKGKHAVVRLFNRAIAGSRLPAWMRKCPDYVPVALYALVSVLVTPTGFVPGWDRAWWLGSAVAFFLFATTILYARHLETRSLELGQQKEVDRVQREHRLELQKLLAYDLVNLIVVIGEVLTERNPAKRRLLASNARNRAVWMAAKRVGKSADQGTRANLFRLNDAKTEMKLEPGGFAGRGDMSRRVFTDSDETFNQIMQNEYVFVESVAEDEVQKQPRTRYRTYIAHPVSIGPDRIHGALTVDCPNAGDLDEAVDVAKVAVFASLIAATYEF